MSEKYIDILKKYLKKNKMKAIGYSDEELVKIEKLYNVELKGDFREFLKFAGRCGGALLGDDPIILYRQSWNIRSYLRMNYFDFIDEDFPALHGELEKKPFMFSMEMENYYYYIRTVDDDLRVYCFNENEEKLEDTGLNFNEHMIGLVKIYNPELKPIRRNPSIGELLVQCDKTEKRITGLREIEEYMSLKERSELLDILKEYLERNKKEFIGYNEDEIRGIEELYNIEVKGAFREFLSLGGKSLGGLLGSDVLTLYKEWSIREVLLSKFIFTKYLINDEFYETSSGKTFVISIENEINYYFIVTKDEDMKVYHYDRSKREIRETGMDLNEYIVYLVKKNNPGLKELEGISIKGDIINI